ncbi:MAG: DUF488 family protein [Chloroflexi bacterium]|nr:DUF488 family protein [Chloroflexota bacterium]
MPIRIKRIYDEPAEDDGHRVLVDRLWPRGIRREEAHVDEWLKLVAPSDELRKWFNHKVERWPEFRERYLAELETAEQQRQLQRLRDLARWQPLTLLYGARDAEHNQAVVLLEALT